MSITRKKLEVFLNEYLNIREYDDFCPNGLQIEGKNTIKKICFAVSASKDAIDKAVKEKADALITHHGLIWKHGGGKPIKGALKNRLFPIIKNDINLFGIHLPLDGHIEIGHAAIIAKKLGLKNIEPFCEYKGSPVGVKGTFQSVVAANGLKNKLERILNHNVIVASPGKSHKIKSIGIVTGGASSHHHDARKQNLDAFLTGEISEYDWYDSQEAGICMFAGGHTATEEFGVKALMELLKKEFKLECKFIKSSNPV